MTLFKIGETYDMENGGRFKVTGYEPELSPNRPLIGLSQYTKGGPWFAGLRREDGSIESKGLSLIPPRKKFWLNIYKDKEGDFHPGLHLYPTEMDVCQEQIGDVVACIPIEFLEGEGLSDD